MGEEWWAVSKKGGKICVIDPFGLGFFGRLGLGWGIFCNWEPIFGKRRRNK
jgi:hypothetical protein